MDYKNSLNLPQTDFPMKANLPTREPEQIKTWDADKTYRAMVDRNRGNPIFTFHDGPPYANGNIHIGHTLNKVLKDIVVKYKNMSGNLTDFIPGWDCHGLPIELGVEKQLREQKIEKSKLSKVEIRKLCKEYALKWIAIQKDQFKRLGVFADWENRYATLDDGYVANILRELGRIAARGALYKGNKPVYWCSSCATALADAEIEYHDHTSPSIYVKFYLDADSQKKLGLKDKTAMVIWTTTPWTLPANLGISAHPEFDYVAVDAGNGESVIVAEGLLEKFRKDTGVAGAVVSKFKGAQFDRLNAEHPFMGRKSLVMLGEHVTLEAGTGLVHTAPGHGMDDFIVGKKYGLEAYAPVDAYGKFTDDVRAKIPVENARIFDANKIIVELLEKSGHLLKLSQLQHSYPHCWRCSKPVFFRATPQWFISMDKTALRSRAIDAIRKVEWIPEWGINRILGMVESRPDWCISRQRVWGVPITVFYCNKCDESVATPESFEHVAGIIEKNGPNVWYEWDAAKLMKPGTKCICGESNPEGFRKETDILDVWFDSGVSHAAVLADPKNKDKAHWPADLYLEGSDQHRGWFQTSLITAVEARGGAPFKRVLTHGFVNDKDGKKMSKSKGNVADPLDFCGKYGAEILRIWVVTEDYRNDLSFSMETIERISESYRKVRNTFRYILGNLYDYDPASAPKDSDFCDLDQWALKKTEVFLDKLKAAYDSYEFHQAYHALVNFCAVDLSAVYFDVLKDRLYTSGKNSKERKSSQAALHRIGVALASGLAPVFCFTAEEVWKYLKQPDSVFTSEFPKWKSNPARDEAFARVEHALKFRAPINKAIEESRAAKELGHPLEASVRLEAPKADLAVLKSVREDLARLFIVSKLELVDGSGDNPAVKVSKAQGTKCARCWTYTAEVGADSQHPEICGRCIKAIQ